MQHWNYLLLEIAMLTTVALFAWQRSTVESLRSKWFRRRALLLFGLWFALDQLAVEFNVWSFPDGGTLPIRILRLPLEEYLCFIGHTTITVLLVRLLETQEAWDATRH